MCPWPAWKTLLMIQRCAYPHSTLSPTVCAPRPPDKTLLRQRRAHERYLGPRPDIGDDTLYGPPQHLAALLLELAVSLAA